MVDMHPPTPTNGAAPGSPGAEAVAELNEAWQAAIEAEAQPDAGVPAWPVDAQVIDAVDAAGLQALLALDPPPPPSAPSPRVPPRPGSGPALRLVPNPARPAVDAAQASTGDSPSTSGAAPA